MKARHIIGTLLALFSVPALSQGTTFYCQEQFSVEHVLESAKSIVARYGTEETKTLVSSATAGNTQALEQLFVMARSENNLIHVQGVYGIIAVGNHSGPTVDEIGDLLTELADSTDLVRASRFINIMSLALSLGENAGPLLPKLTPFLYSKNFHEIYWALKAITSMRSEAASLAPDLVKLFKEPNTTVSVKRHILIALGAMGMSVGQEGLELIEEGLTSFYHPIREMAVLAIINLGEPAPDSLKIKAMNLFQKNDSHILESHIASAVFSNDPTQVIAGYKIGPDLYVSSTSNYLLHAYLEYLGPRSVELAPLLETLMADSNPDYQEYGAELVMKMKEYAPSNLKVKALKILQQ